MAAVRILIVDDDPGVARTLARNIGRRGYVTTAVNSYEEAVALLKIKSFDLAVIDFLMPDRDGVELSRYIRQHYPEIGTIIISGMPNDDLFRKGFGSADRYVDKAKTLEPLLRAIEEVLSENAAEGERILRLLALHAQARPSNSARNSKKPLPPPSLKIGNLVLDFARLRFRLRKVSLGLTPKEIAVLSQLVARAGEPVERESLEEIVRDSPDDPDAARKLNRIVHRLRKKFNGASPTELVLKTVWGVGYCLEINTVAPDDGRSPPNIPLVDI